MIMLKKYIILIFVVCLYLQFCKSYSFGDENSNSLCFSNEDTIVLNGLIDYNVLKLGIDPSSDYIFACDWVNGSIKFFNHNGQLIKSIGYSSKQKIGLVSPQGVDIDDKGNIYIVDDEAEKLFVFSKDGELVKMYPDLYGRGLWDVLVWGNKLYTVYFVSRPPGVKDYYLVTQRNLNYKKLKSFHKLQNEIFYFTGCTFVSSDRSKYLYVVTETEYKVMKYSADGNLVKVFAPSPTSLDTTLYRAPTILPPTKINAVEMTKWFSSFTSVWGIWTWKDYVIVQLVNRVKNDPNRQIDNAILDIYDTQGTFVKSVKLSHKILVAIDKNDYFYFRTIKDSSTDIVLTKCKFSLH